MYVLETCLYVDDLLAAAHFYGEVLGFKQIAYAPERHLFYQVDHGVLLLFLPHVTAQESVLPPHGATGPGHVAFAVADSEIDGWKERFTQAQVPIAAEHIWPRGGRSIYVRDPSGNVVELAPPGIWGLEVAGNTL